MSLHEQCVGATDEWYTPPHVFKALGCDFDTDVASPGPRITPWIPAKRFITVETSGDGLTCPWVGFVWMNPPFGARNSIIPWLAKFCHHRNGIALTPDRTSAPWWQLFASEVDQILFVCPKIKFIGADGMPGKSPAQGTTLLAFGERGVEALNRASRSGLGILATPHPILRGSMA